MSGDDHRPAASVLDGLRRAFYGHDLGAPLGWDGVLRYEAAHGVALPEPYRTFVAEIGNGCPDGPPLCGLLALGEIPARYYDGATRPAPARTFPLSRPGWVWEAEVEPDRAAIRAVYSDGLVLLGDDGCGMYWALITQGPERGEVWSITDVGAQPWSGASGYTTGTRGFDGWVYHWTSGKTWWDRQPPAV